MSWQWQKTWVVLLTSCDPLPYKLLTNGHYFLFGDVGRIMTASR